MREPQETAQEQAPDVLSLKKMKHKHKHKQTKAEAEDELIRLQKKKNKMLHEVIPPSYVIRENAAQVWQYPTLLLCLYGVFLTSLIHQTCVVNRSMKPRERCFGRHSGSPNIRKRGRMLTCDFSLTCMFDLECMLTCIFLYVDMYFFFTCMLKFRMHADMHSSVC